MRVQVDTKELMDMLEAYNPSADFTGVKAYLFDLVVRGQEAGSTPAPKRTRAKKAASPAAELAPAVHLDEALTAPVIPETSEDDSFEFESVPESDPLATIADKVMGKPSSPRKLSDIDLSPRESKRKARDEERKRKRETKVDITKMSGKELLEHLANQTLAKPDENGQFTNEGVDGAGGGDLSLG